VVDAWIFDVGHDPKDARHLNSSNTKYIKTNSLNKFIYLADSSVQAEKEKLGKQMVCKCGYLPVAISLIGGILRKKVALEEWEKVNRHIDSYLRYGRGMEENIQVIQILSLCYDNLPYH
jgi:hypothetical protein